jgi:hypothetical protein
MPRIYVPQLNPKYIHIHEGKLRISTYRSLKSSPLCKGAGSVGLRLGFYGLLPRDLRQLKASRDEVKFISVKSYFTCTSRTKT